MTVTKRTLIRIVAFSIAIIAALLVRNIILMKERADARLTIETGYLRAISDLSTSTDNLSNTLSKELCAGTSEMHTKLASELWREASNAKLALSQLPVSELSLENTNKFLSQVGNYANYIASKTDNGGKISDKEYETLRKLYEFSKKLKTDIWSIEQMLTSGELDADEIIDSLNATSATDENTPSLTEGFTEFEEGFDSYPTLVYDGPFSDHILEKQPLMLKGASEVSEGTAKAKACQALGVTETELNVTEAEMSKMPSFCFSTGTSTIAVTKAGGYISYMLKSRDVENTSISSSQAQNKAVEYLKRLGINEMTITYYETIGNVCTVNFAYKSGDVTVYTDLIKVSVAMDNGEIMGMDARGYIVNHKDRNFEKPKLSKDDALKSVSPMLKVSNVKLANIPSDGTNERYCYEFTCVDTDNRHVLVYVNCETGKEEQILILFESEAGVLAM